MKKLSKLLSLLLAMALCLSLAPAAFAASATPKDGKITISDAIPGQTYKAYKMLDLAEGFDSVNNTGYLYTVATGWEAFFAEGGAGHDYVDIHENQGALKYVTWKEDVANDAAEVQAFAQAALQYAATLTPTATEASNAATGNSDRTTVTFSGLDLGYYLVDSSAGSLVSLNTADKEAKITDKNAIPDINKEVQEDSDSSWGNVNDADTNQVVTFRTVVTVYAGADKDYIVHDKMQNLDFTDVTSVVLNPVGLTLKEDGTVDNPGTGGQVLTGTDVYEVANPAGDGDTFDITFITSKLNPLLTADIATPESALGNKHNANYLVITYTAKLTEDAFASRGQNDIYLEWGDENHTKTHHTDTYTGGLTIKKTDGDTNQPLDGAKFAITRKNGETTEYALVEGGFVKDWVPEAEDGGVPAVPEGKTGAIELSTTGGTLTVSGLDADTYNIVETEAPTGYNALEGPVSATVTIDRTNGKVSVTYGDNKDGSAGVEIANFTGTRLPSTGGIGTTIFYVIGGALVLGAAVLLITKKRMNGRD